MISHITHALSIISREFSNIHKPVIKPAPQNPDGPMIHFPLVSGDNRHRQNAFRDLVGALKNNNLENVQNSALALKRFPGAIDQEAKLLGNRTPLTYIAARKDLADEQKIQLWKTLVSAGGANPNVKDFGGVNPFHYAAKMGSKEATDFYLANGADATIRTSGGHSALQLAAMQLKIHTHEQRKAVAQSDSDRVKNLFERHQAMALGKPVPAQWMAPPAASFQPDHHGCIASIDQALEKDKFSRIPLRDPKLRIKFRTPVPQPQDAGFRITAPRLERLENSLQYGGQVTSSNGRQMGFKKEPLQTPAIQAPARRYSVV